MSLHGEQAKLNDAMKKLDAAWRRAREDWRDEVARRFEAEHIQPLIAHTRAAVSAIAPLEETLQKAQRECEAEEGH